jgi:hypothetical protein
VIFIYDPDAYSKILAVEGQGWISGGGRAIAPYDFESVLNSWKNREDDGYFEHSVIYGAAGGNRYFVDELGEITYSRSHGIAALDKAQSLGFRIS